MYKGFTDDEMETYLHAAGYALGNTDIFNEIATYLNYNDEDLVIMRAKLYDWICS